MKILILIIVSSFLFSCSAKRDPIKTIKVKFSLPQSSQKAFDTSQNPTAVSGFNCVAVFISYPDKSNGTCTDLNGVNLATPFDMVGMVIRPGGQLEADVEVGPNRTFHLVGFNADLASLGGACPDVKANFSTFETHLSEPYIIGQVSAEILPVSTQNISFNSTFDSDKKINDCTGSLFDDIGNAGNNFFVDFGDGLDGDDTITGSLNSTYYLKVTSINSVNPKEITFASTPDPSLFAIGKEVMWYVNEEGSPTSTDSCGISPSSFHPGMFNFNRVTGSSGNVLTFERPFNEYINLAGATETLDIPINSLLSASASTGSFCGIQIVSVPNYQNLTVSTGGLSPSAYSRTTGVGGLRVIKVNGTLTFAASSAPIINAGSVGFPVDVPAPPPSSECLSNDKECLLMGGGGLTAESGSTGGGIFIIYADIVDLNSSSTVIMSANGGTGAEGGSFILRSKNIIFNNSSLALNAKGGNASGTGGDGGLAIYNYCTETDARTLTFDVAEGTGGSPAAGTAIDQVGLYCN